MTDEIKLPLTSTDVTEDLLMQLREAAPQIFNEGRIDFTKLQAALGEHVETNQERYGLTWAGTERSAQVKEEPAQRAGDTQQNVLPSRLLAAHLHPLRHPSPCWSLAKPAAWVTPD